MIPSKAERDEWRKLANETEMISAVGEYTPEEFTILLDAVDELELQVFRLREALALHHSMVLGGEKESPASEACFRLAMDSSR